MPALSRVYQTPADPSSVPGPRLGTGPGMKTKLLTQWAGVHVTLYDKGVGTGLMAEKGTTWSEDCRVARGYFSWGLEGCRSSSAETGRGSQRGRA